MENKNISKIVNLILKAVGLAMGIAVVVLNILNQLEEKSALTMLGIGLFCISLACLSNPKENIK